MHETPSEVGERRFMKKPTLQKIIDNGGATINARGRSVSYKTGYQVSNKDCYILNSNNINDIINAINDLRRTVAPADFIGIWVDNGKVYIDLSTRIVDRAEAIFWGKMLKQKAIYDWQNQNCITL